MYYSSLHLAVANHQALLGCYNFNMWQSMAKFKDSLPEDPKKFHEVSRRGQSCSQSSPPGSIKCGGHCSQNNGLGHLNEEGILAALGRSVNGDPTVDTGPLYPGPSQKLV